MRYAIALWSLICLMGACKTEPSQTNTSSGFAPIDIQGHRGCRGLMPENTIPAFIKAVELGVMTLELDLAITGDSQVIVSHEPFFRSEISMKPDGTPVTKEEQHSLNMYKMSYDSIKRYDVGTLPDPRHPDRQNIKTSRPLLSEVIAAVEDYCEKKDLNMPYWNIEIKRKPEYDNIYHPDAERFVELVLPVIKSIEGLVTIQSFDPESLRVCREKDPNLSYALLIENDQSPAENVKNLGFKPDIYSSYFKLVDADLMAYCRDQNIRVIPWTVNDPKDIKAMKALGVDGIISDYPDRVIEIYGEDGHH